MVDAEFVNERRHHVAVAQRRLGGRSLKAREVNSAETEWFPREAPAELVDAGLESQVLGNGERVDDVFRNPTQEFGEIGLGEVGPVHEHRLIPHAS